MIIEVCDLKKIKELGKKTVICAGWFDMFHYGHLQFLNNAKVNGDILVVVVMNDKGIKPLKGNNRPIISEEQRINIIDNIKAVDYTILSEPVLDINDLIEKYNILNNYKERLLWSEYIPIIEQLQPEVVFSVPETMQYESLRRKIMEIGSRIVYTNYYEGISTTEIVKKAR